MHASATTTSPGRRAAGRPRRLGRQQLNVVGGLRVCGVTRVGRQVGQPNPQVATFVDPTRRRPRGVVVSQRVRRRSGSDTVSHCLDPVVLLGQPTMRIEFAGGLIEEPLAVRSAQHGEPVEPGQQADKALIHRYQTVFATLPLGDGQHHGVEVDVGAA